MVEDINSYKCLIVGEHMTKRKISIGFVSRDRGLMEGDTIYVNLAKWDKKSELRDEPVLAVAESSKDFKFHAYQKDHLAKRVMNTQYSMSVNTFINNLVENNNGELDYVRACKEGTYAFRLIRGLQKDVYFEGDLPKIK